MKFYICLFVLLFSANVFSQDKILPPNVLAHIRSRIDAGMNQSIVIGIIDKNGSQFYSFGKKKKNGKKANSHTVYEIGSISKVFTATIFADKIIKGELHADDGVQLFLPGNVNAPEFKDNHITLGSLSDHTSSLPRLPDNYFPQNPANPYADFTIDKLYEFLSNYKLTRDIGSQYEYSNVGVGLLGHVLALHDGITFEQLLATSITIPLSMNETKITLSKKMKKNLATGYDQDIAVSNWDLPALAGAGGIRSSAFDVVKFLGANLQLYNHPLQEAMILTHIPRHDKEGTTRVALGWHIDNGSEGDIYYHNGNTGGYSSFAGFVKETGRGVVVLTNSTANVDDLGFHLLDAKIPLKNAVPHVSIILKNLIEKDGSDNLSGTFDKIKKENNDKYDYSESGMNALGYYFLNRKKFKEAVDVFKLNIRESPNSANVYDSYAEALMEQGNIEQAVENYKKSLSINPGNQNAISMLAKMGVSIDIPNVVIDSTVLQSYVGRYQISPEFSIYITRSGHRLMSQATGQAAYEIFAKSPEEFYYKVVEAQIKFIKQQDGRVKGLVLYQAGREIEGKKIE